MFWDILKYLLGLKPDIQPEPKPITVPKPAPPSDPVPPPEPENPVMTATEIQQWIDSEDDILIPPGLYILDKVLWIKKPKRFRGSGYSTIFKPSHETVNRIYGTTLLISPELAPLTIIQSENTYPWLASGTVQFPFTDDAWLEIGHLDPSIGPIALVYKPELPAGYEDRRSLISGQIHLYYNGYLNKFQLLLDSGVWFTHSEPAKKDDFNSLELGTDYLRVNGSSESVQYKSTLDQAVIGFDYPNGIPGPGGYLRGIGMRFNETEGLLTPTTRTVDAILRRGTYNTSLEAPNHTIVSDIRFQGGDKAIHAMQSHSLLFERLYCDHQQYLNIELDNNCYLSSIRHMRGIATPTSRAGIRCRNNSGASIYDSWLIASGNIIDYIDGTELVSNTLLDCSASTVHGISARSQGGVSELRIRDCKFSDESAVWAGSSILESFLHVNRINKTILDGATMVRCLAAHRPEWYTADPTSQVVVRDLAQYDLNL